MSLRSIFTSFKLVQNSRATISSFSSIVRHKSSDVHNQEDNIEECGRSKKAEAEAKRLREKTPIGKLEQLEGTHPYAEKEPLKKHPGGVNPITGEVGGPAGPEPTRYGDWERKGRVTDF